MMVTVLTYFALLLGALMVAVILFVGLTKIRLI